MSGNNEIAVSVDGLTKKYGEKLAVNDVSLEIKKGEIFSLVGPNGAGKTTTVEILECLRSPTEGEATILGYNIKEDEEEIKRNIGVMPQDFNSFERLTARENIELMASIYDKKGIEEVIEKTGVDEFEETRFNQLSGGMKTRVGIAMALVSDADLLFLDEPTSGLDPQARRDIWSLIMDLKSMCKTIILTTHYMEEVEKLSDRAAILVDGEVKTVDTIENLIKKYSGEAKITVKNQGEAKKIVEESSDQIINENNQELTGVYENRQDTREALIELLQKDCKVSLDEGGMDEVFLKIAGAKINEKGELV